MPLIVRDATPADVPAIAALYADEVRDHVNTYEYDVPDQAEMLRRIHEVVGRLMFAENFYIVRYAPERDTMRFIYFADSQDPVIVATYKAVRELMSAGFTTQVDGLWRVNRAPTERRCT